VWENYFNPITLRQKELERGYKEYTNAISKAEQTLKNDSYGGHTPEETLTIFIDALKKGDIELASKYFSLNTNMQSPDYLTRKKWLDWLNSLKKEGQISVMIDNIEKMAKPDLTQRLNDNDYKFILRTENGVVGAIIDMELNKYSGVWKIESL
jgi:hypothetical protein